MALPKPAALVRSVKAADTLPRRRLAARGTANVTAGGPQKAQVTRLARYGFTSVGLNNRQHGGGSVVTLTNAKGYAKQKPAVISGVQAKWSFFDNATSAVNEAFPGGQINFGAQDGLSIMTWRTCDLKIILLLTLGSIRITKWRSFVNQHSSAYSKGVPLLWAAGINNATFRVYELLHLALQDLATIISSSNYYDLVVEQYFFSSAKSDKPYRVMSTANIGTAQLFYSFLR